MLAKLSNQSSLWRKTSARPLGEGVSEINIEKA
jgi:hypothetical protein